MKRTHNDRAEMTDEIDWTLLDRYYSGECSPLEKETVERWAASAPERTELLDATRRIWQEAGVVPRVYDSRAAWPALRDRLATLGAVAPTLRLAPVTPIKSLPARSYRGLRLYGGIAASLLVAAGIGWTARNSGKTTDSSDLSGPMREWVAARGQRAEVLLSDGTRAWLNAESRLRVPAAYGGRSRTVYLEGEALFEVIHDEQRPFIVHTDDAVAEDLGTEFVVRAYPRDSVSTVVVVSGRVAVRAATPGGKRGVVIEPNQLGRVDRTGLITIESDVDVGPHVAWRHGRLEFRRTPLSRVLDDLERLYDVDIVIDDSVLADLPVTAALRSQALEDVLDIVSRSSDLRYERQGRVVRLRAADR